MKPVDQKNLEQGSDFMMVVKVTNNTFTVIDNIALTQMVPFRMGDPEYQAV